MIYKEIQKNMFVYDFDEWAIAHCISSDFKMGTGIVVLITGTF